jgi:sulfopropanediol 3-dehydrogenase
MRHLKSAQPASAQAARDESVTRTVAAILEQISSRGEDAVREQAVRFDNWHGEFVLDAEQRRSLIARVPETVKSDLRFAHAQVRRFADAQRASLSEFEIETEPGVRLGQRVVPVDCAGCYVPGGRYAHAASAIMSVATAKAAGVGFIVACSPPRGEGIDPAVAFALDLAGADLILQMGGVHAMATMAHGLFSGRAADILVGPGNAFVSEAKRLLFGRVGIDVLAGPTESAIIADETADPMTIAVDLVSQAEHGPDSPVWLFTTSSSVAQAVLDLVPRLAAQMPNESIVLQAWQACGEIIVCDDRDEIVAVSDRYAAEHLQVMAADLDWYRQNLRNYGSLFLGEGSTVTHGDKCAGTNHILPTRGAARYSGGLNVQKFLKVLTYQSISREANAVFSAVGSRISRAEGMEGHARACDWRLQRYFPDRSWNFPVYSQPQP